LPGSVTSQAGGDDGRRIQLKEQLVAADVATGADDRQGCEPFLFGDPAVGRKIFAALQEAVACSTSGASPPRRQ